MVTSLFDIDFGFIPQRNVKGYNLYPPPGWLSYVRMSACFTKEYWRYITRIFPKTTPCRWLTFIRIGGSLCSELVAHFGAEYTLINNCLKGAVVASKKYPQITLDYCTCSINKIMQSIGRKEYVENSSKSPDEQFRIDSPFIQGCVIIFSRQLDSVKKQGK
jgi:hypothetical protein